jgi:hypothetical protein
MSDPNVPPPSNGTGWTQPVNKAINALHGTPMLLVLAVLNFMMFGMITYLIIKSAEYRFHERTELVKLLGACYELQKRGSFTPQRRSPAPNESSVPKMSIPVRKPTP